MWIQPLETPKAIAFSTDLRIFQMWTVYFSINSLSIYYRFAVCVCVCVFGIFVLFFLFFIFSVCLYLRAISTVTMLLFTNYHFNDKRLRNYIHHINDYFRLIFFCHWIFDSYLRCIVYVFVFVVALFSISMTSLDSILWWILMILCVILFEFEYFRTWDNFKCYIFWHFAIPLHTFHVNWLKIESVLDIGNCVCHQWMPSHNWNIKLYVIYIWIWAGS